MGGASRWDLAARSGRSPDHLSDDLWKDASVDELLVERSVCPREHDPQSGSQTQGAQPKSRRLGGIAATDGRYWVPRGIFQGGRGSVCTAE
jgi:hypothetical protein